MTYLDTKTLDGAYIAVQRGRRWAVVAVARPGAPRPAPESLVQVAALARALAGPTISCAGCASLAHWSLRCPAEHADRVLAALLAADAGDDRLVESLVPDYLRWLVAASTPRCEAALAELLDTP